jgi:hypothetical protein
MPSIWSCGTPRIILKWTRNEILFTEKLRADLRPGMLVTF